MHAIDQLGREVKIPHPPQRIVSLVPSQSEFLYDLGLGERLAGVTRFCVHPQNLRTEATVVGGTKQVKIERIHKLKPDLIVANKEENTPEMVAQLEKHYPVWVSAVNTVDDALEMMRLLGQVCGKSAEADDLTERISEARGRLHEAADTVKSRSVAYLIWRNPYMAAGSGTYIHSVLLECGLKNSVNSARYPEADIEELKKSDVVLLSSEPYPFSEKHLSELKAGGCKRVELVNGEWFSWYGSRMLSAFDALAAWVTKL